MPAQAELEELQRLQQQQFAAHTRREEKERREAWQAWLAREWGTRLGAVYRWLRDNPFAPPVVFLAQPDGSAKANVREMDGLLREAWGPINRKYAEAPEPCPEACMAKYGHHLRKVPMLASKVTGGLLRKRLRAMLPSFMGLDGWSLQDVRSLPDRAMDWLAQLLQDHAPVTRGRMRAQFLLPHGPAAADSGGRGQVAGRSSRRDTGPSSRNLGRRAPWAPVADGPVHGLLAEVRGSGIRRGPNPKPMASAPVGGPSTEQGSRPSS